jgi:hypothetical protein
MVAMFGVAAKPADAANNKKASIPCSQFTESPIINRNLVGNLTAFYGSPGMPPVLIEDMDQAFSCLVRSRTAPGVRLHARTIHLLDQRWPDYDLEGQHRFIFLMRNTAMLPFFIFSPV